VQPKKINVHAAIIFCRFDFIGAISDCVRRNLFDVTGDLPELNTDISETGSWHVRSSAGV
jgi:hypothetical protein